MSAKLREIVRAADKKLAAAERGERTSLQVADIFDKFVPMQTNILQIIRNYERNTHLRAAHVRVAAKN